MQSNHVVLVLVLTMLMTTVHAQKKKPQDLPFQKFTYKTKSDTLPYALLAPVDKTQKYPLVIFLHGKAERGKDNVQQLSHVQILFNANTYAKYPCIVLAPQCPERYYWSDLVSNKKLTRSPGPPLQMVIDVMEKIIKEYPVDTSRIYVTGVSMGGFATWELISRFPERFAAAVPVCGGGDETVAVKFKNLPIWAFHGAEDAVVPPARSRAMVDALQAAGALPGYTEYPGVKHNSWTWAYKEPHLLPWLFKQKK
jgi:predicted peptidase